MAAVPIWFGIATLYCFLHISPGLGIENLTVNGSILELRTFPPLKFETFHFFPDLQQNVEESDSLPLTPPPVEIATMTDDFVPMEYARTCPDCLPRFEGGADIFYSMSVWDNLVCGKSVCNQTLDSDKCGNLNCDECYCDSECTRYGDCCPDLYLNKPYQQPAARFICVSQAFIDSTFISAESFKMVGTCQGKEKATNDEVITVAKCENPNITNIDDNTPVYSPETKLHYRNLYCAQCNGVTDVTDWDVKPFCRDYVDFSQVNSPDDLLRVLRHEETCAVHFEPPRLSKARPCAYQGDAIKTCNVSGEWRDYDADIERACHLYSQPVKYLDQTYDNVFCLYCNGNHLTARQSCSNQITEPETAPFSVLLNFRQTIETPSITDKKLCSSGEIFDPSIDDCRSLVCPVGKYAENHTCTSLFQSAMGLGYVLHFSLTPKDREYFMVNDLYSLVYSMYRFISEQVYLFRPKYTVFHSNITFQTVNDSLDFQVIELDIQFSTLIGDVMPREEAEARLLELFTSRWWWYNLGSTSPVDLHFQWLPGVSDERLSEYSTIGDSASHEPTDIVRTVSNTIQEEIPWDNIPNAFRTNVSAYILVSELLMCNMIELNVSEYTIINPNRIFINSTGQTLDEGQFLWNGDRVRVCTNLTGDIYTTNPNPGDKSTFDQTEVTLTLVCTSLSLCGLAITVIIYLAMPSLRAKLPGKNNIFLFVNLFLAQLLFLSGTSANVSTSACRALGIIIHYFWLSTFCWKVVCAFHMYRLFTNPLKTLDQKKSLCKYIVFSQMFPCLVIILVIFVNFGLSGMTQIGYAVRQNLCFLSGNLNVALGFAVPVGLVLLVNAAFFSRVIYALRHRPKIQRHASKSDVKESVIYFKMSLILGFTWVLGFIAVIANEQGLWYVFTVVNASLGVFVFLSFGMKNLSLKIVTGGHNSSKTYETTTGAVSKEQETYETTAGAVSKEQETYETTAGAVSKE